jgi:stearoyl-CoA desaturase (delta-9 desaturase)
MPTLFLYGGKERLGGGARWQMFGRRDFRTSDRSMNNLIVGVLAWGEGWHNNHHAFPTSARHRLVWWQLDPSWLLIRAMERLGLVWNVRLPGPTAIAEKRLVR